tara:strand:- start:425 stop:1318 length:894 start_codon:yes stop_codon:yes gene_type:complete
MNLIVGTGNVFRDYYYPNLRHKSNYEYYDRDPSNFPAELSDLLLKDIKKENIYETIFILTPPSTHYQLIQDLHLLGKTFYIEKPTFSSLNEFKSTLNLVNDTQIVGGHSRRFFSNYLNFKNLILKQMKDSKITSISAFEGSPYGWNPQQLESILDDEFTHLVDSILFLTGMEEEDLNIEIMNISDSFFREVCVESLVNSINVNIKFSRIRNLVNQINVSFENGISYHLNTNLNGEIFKIKNNVIHTVKSGTKQSSIGVFSEIINYMENFSEHRDHKYNLLKFQNTLAVIDAIKEKSL